MVVVTDGVSGLWVQATNGSGDRPFINLKAHPVVDMELGAELLGSRLNVLTFGTDDFR